MAQGDWTETKVSRRLTSSVAIERVRNSFDNSDYLVLHNPDASGGRLNISKVLLEMINTFKKETD